VLISTIALDQSAREKSLSYSKKKDWEKKELQSKMNKDEDAKKKEKRRQGKVQRKKRSLEAIKTNDK